MKLVELLNKLQSENSPAVINGVVGKIIGVDEELLTLETVRKKDGGKVLVKETIHIPLHNIMTVSEGEREIPKSEKEKAVEGELEEMLAKSVETVGEAKS